MDVAARRNRTLFRWIMVTLLAVLMPFAALAQPAAGQAEAATAAEEARCRACSYERIGHKVDIGLVALVSLLVVGLLVAASREWGTTSQRWWVSVWHCCGGLAASSTWATTRGRKWPPLSMVRLPRHCSTPHRSGWRRWR